VFTDEKAGHAGAVLREDNRYRRRLLKELKVFAPDFTYEWDYLGGLLFQVHIIQNQASVWSAVFPARWAHWILTIDEFLESEVKRHLKDKKT